MKVHKLEVLVYDFENYGIDEYVVALNQNNDYHMRVLDYQTKEIGEWSDAHPLNHPETLMEYVDEIFG